MRKFNAILTALILVLFILHAVFGSLQMLGIGSTALKTLAWVNVGLIVLHVLIGIKFTFDTLSAQRKTGVSYFKENRLFWARRISGFAIMILLFFHLTAFGQTVDGVERLQWFDTAKLVTNILLVLSIALHVITNAKPMLISFGIKSLKKYAGDILFVLAILMVFIAAAFIVYYIRWNS